MYRDRKIILVVPAGRKGYLDILLRYIKTFEGIIDECHLWRNPKIGESEDNQNIIDWCNRDPFFKRIELGAPVNRGATVPLFYKFCMETDTVYIKADDDIVFMDTNLSDFLDYRIDNPQYFLVFANTINNAICGFIQQRTTGLDYMNKIIGYVGNDKIGHGDAQFAELFHRRFIKSLDENDLERWKKIPEWILTNTEVCSVNFISWFGQDFASFGGQCSKGRDELELCTIIPARMKKRNAIFGKYIVAHFAFYTQRDHLDNTNLLELYKKNAEKRIGSW